MNSFSGVERALEVEFARQCARARRRRHDRAADDAVGRRTRTKCGRRARRKEATTIATSRSRIFRRSSSTPSGSIAIATRAARAAGRRAATRFAHDVSRSATYDVEVLTVEPRARRLLRGSRARMRRRKDGGELGAGRSARGAQEHRARRSTHFACARPISLQLLDLVRDGTVSHSAGEADLRDDGRRRAIRRRRSPSAKGLLKVSDDSALVALDRRSVRRASGRSGALPRRREALQGVLVGLVMKKSKGSADPKRVNQLLAARAGA